MNRWVNVIIVFILAVISIAANTYWLFNTNTQPLLIIKINIITGICLLLTVGTVIYKKARKK
jgi:hypothetical protein